jgi:hypothetical protein
VRHIPPARWLSSRLINELANWKQKYLPVLASSMHHLSRHLSDKWVHQLHATLSKYTKDSYWLLLRSALSEALLLINKQQPSTLISTHITHQSSAQRLRTHSHTSHDPTSFYKSHSHTHVHITCNTQAYKHTSICTSPHFPHIYTRQIHNTHVQTHMKL